MSERAPDPIISRPPRARWTPSCAAAIAVGGALGAGLRWLVLTQVPPGRFPWPVLVINLAGSFVLGAVMAEQWAHPRRRLLLHDAAGIGLCGGLTTMSTFVVEVADLLDGGHVGTASVYVVASVLGGLLAVVGGAAVLHRTRALVLPLEERP